MIFRSTKENENLTYLMLVCPPKSQTWNLRFLYVTCSTLKPMVGMVVTTSPTYTNEWSRYFIFWNCLNIHYIILYKYQSNKICNCLPVVDIIMSFCQHHQVQESVFSFLCFQIDLESSSLIHPFLYSKCQTFRLKNMLNYWFLKISIWLDE